MDHLPKSPSGRAAAGIWLLLCVGVLALGYVQRGVHDMPEAFVWLMNYLSMPSGFVLGALVLMYWTVAERMLHIPHHPFWQLVPFWFTTTAVGYVQWFVLCPAIWKKWRGSKPGGARQNRV